MWLGSSTMDNGLRLPILVQPAGIGCLGAAQRLRTQRASGSGFDFLTLRQPASQDKLAFPAPRPTAPEAALSVWQQVTAWSATVNEGRERVFDRLVPSVRGWASGDDGFESWATLGLGVIFPPDLPPEAW